jgi:hypothetical protein
VTPVTEVPVTPADGFVLKLAVETPDTDSLNVTVH